MSRITGKQALGLFEAYQAVYAPQELSEEQIWEEVEEWVNSLLEEGYDLSDYTWEEMYEAYIEEARAEGVKPYKAGPSQADVRADAAAARQKHVAGASGQKGYGHEDKFKSDWKLRATPSSTSKRRDGSVETVSQRMDREQPYKKRMTGELARKQGSRIASAVTRTIEGPGEPQAVTMPRMKAKVSKEIVRKEEVDVYDVVLSHLLDEGYANSVESAEAIMVNMSEQWIDTIIEDFDQLDEAEGSYGETPKAYSAARKTKMTAKRKPFLKKMLSRTNPANRTSTYDSPRKGLTADDRERARAGSAYGVGTRDDHDYPSQGAGGVTKSAKKLRKQRAMGEID